MALYPVAQQKPIVRNFGGRRTTTTASILHVDAGGAASLQGWFNNPAASASSHFYVKYDGTVEQYLDTDIIAWTSRAANLYSVGIETQGLGSGSWTDAQMASISALLRWLGGIYGHGLNMMLDSKRGRKGVGYHRQGCAPWRVVGGDVWGPSGKICPGPRRVDQVHAVLSAASSAIPISNPILPPAPPVETEEQRIARMNAGYSQEWIRSTQHKLNVLGSNLVEDGVRGELTIAEIVEFQSSHGLVPDGLPGPVTHAKLDQVIATRSATPPVATLALQAAVRAYRDNKWGDDTDKRLDAVRRASTMFGNKFPYGVAFTQGCVGARQDNSWGPLSGAAHDATVMEIQKALKSCGLYNGAIDGIWGPGTDAGYTTARARAYMKF